MRFAADENFNNHILRALVQRIPTIDILRIQDTEMYTKPDPLVLEWAAKEGRILLSHDFTTLPNFAYTRIEAGLPIAGLIMVNVDASMSLIVDHLQIMIEVGNEADFVNQVLYIPFR